MSEKISSFVQWISEHKKATIIASIATIIILLLLFILSKSSSPSSSGEKLSLPERFSSELENIGSSIGLRPKPTEVPKDREKIPGTDITRINFDYKVTTIVDGRVSLEGKRGALILSKDLEKEILIGNYTNSTKGSIDNLKVGQTVRIDLVLGKKAWIYILKE